MTRRHEGGRRKREGLQDITNNREEEKYEYAGVVDERREERGRRIR